jgi:hypothetical protein
MLFHVEWRGGCRVVLRCHVEQREGNEAEESQTAILLCPVTDIIQYIGLMCSGVLCVRVILLYCVLSRNNNS